MVEAGVRYAWFGAGWVSVVFGAVGIVVPGWPTTVFFIAAAGCFSHSSPRFERWVLGLPGIGVIVSDYRAGGGMPFRVKVIALTMMWAAILSSVIFFIALNPVRAIVLALGTIGTWVIVWRIPTSTRTKPLDENEASASDN